MKQVYTKEQSVRNARIRGGAFFIGLLVWLLAVASTFGQSNKPESPAGPSGADPSKPADAPVSISAPASACYGTSALAVTCKRQ